MNKILLPVFAVAAIGGGVFGYLQMSAASEKQTLLDQLQGKLTQAEKDRDAAEAARKKALADLEEAEANRARLAKERDDQKAKNQELIANAAKNEGIAAAGTPAQPQASADQKLGSEIRNRMQDFFNNPEMRNGIKSGQDRLITQVYGNLFTKMGLDEQTSKLASGLIGDRNMAALDIGRKVMEAGGDEAKMAAVRKEIEGVKSEYDGKLRSVLGAEGFNEFSAYEQTVGDVRSLDGIARGFERNGMALAENQRTSLENIMREERLRNPSGNTIPDLGGGPGMAMLMNDADAKAAQQTEEAYQARVISRATQAGLSPDQVNALQDSYKRRNEQQAMGRNFGRLFLGGGAGRR